MFKHRYFHGLATLALTSCISACSASTQANVQSAPDGPKPVEPEKIVVDTTNVEKRAADTPNSDPPKEELLGVEGGVEGGVVGGVLNGVPGGRATANDPPTRPDSPIPFGMGMTRPSQISGPSVSAGITVQAPGLWVGRCVLKEDGSVTECKVMKSLPTVDKLLVRNLEAQKYTPVVYQGQPQRVYYTFKVNFK